VHQQQALGFGPSIKLPPPMNAINGVKWFFEIGGSFSPIGLKFIEAGIVEKEPSHRCERMAMMGTCLIKKGAQSYTRSMNDRNDWSAAELAACVWARAG